MKEIRAYVQPFMLHHITQELLELPHFPGMSMSDCLGFGKEHTDEAQDYMPFLGKKRLEIFAPDDMVEQIFTIIMKYANTHQNGAGKVFILPVIEGGHIRTGERGADVV